ncbi:MAG TPA: hypothetical protein VJN71_10785, partial [Nitrososphaerales archaeon]|nr:hypothetical protein [Nitrososphaerales archaeon]
RVMNDLDEKLHRLIEIFIGNPQLIRTVWDDPSRVSPDLATSYYVQFIAAHVYHMRQRKILSDNEWMGWFEWMKNSFRYGKVAKLWKEAEMGSWFDPSFREFVNKELIPQASATNAAKN